MQEGSMAEWSKAPALGAGPKGRGFEPHCCQSLVSRPYTFVSEFGNRKRCVSSRGPMDKALPSGGKDCRFDSYRE